MLADDRQRPSIMSAAFSAIMIVGALVLPLMIVGMIEGIDYAQRLHAAHSQGRVDHRVRIHSHSAGAHRVIHRRGFSSGPTAS